MPMQLKNLFKFRHLPTAILALCISSTPGTSEAAKSNSWLLERYDQYSGKGNVYCSELGYRVTSEKIPFVTLCVPPSWSVVLINPKKKLYFNCSDRSQVKHMAGFALMKAVSTRAMVDNLKWEKAYSTSYRGHPIAVWQALTGKRLSTQKNLQNSFDGFEYWVAEDISIPTALAVFNHKVHDWPEVNHLPMRFIRCRPNKKPEVLLETESIKRTTVLAETFQIPKGFKESKTEMDVGTGESSENLQMMIEGLGGDGPKSGKTSNIK